jgi:hypothetical protein
MLLVVKLKGAALDAFHDNEEYINRGFEMMDKLHETSAPSCQSDIYTNFLSLVSVEMGAKDMLDHFISQIH